MKYLIYSILCLLLGIYSCNTDSNTNPKEQKKKSQKLEQPNIDLNECIKRIIYFRSQADLNFYDSLSIHYYHELEDYIEPVAIKLNDEIDSLRNLVHQGVYDDISPIHRRIDSLKAELSPYHKFVVGFAFVHTFKIDNDTISAIFVMDTLCGFGDMIPVSEKILTDPIKDKGYNKKIKKKPQ